VFVPALGSVTMPASCAEGGEHSEAWWQDHEGYHQVIKNSNKNRYEKEKIY
jgi:uncharacterized radical SAM superfamily Fe-S cluster-containing enzyme